MAREGLHDNEGAMGELEAALSAGGMSTEGLSGAHLGAPPPIEGGDDGGGDGQVALHTRINVNSGGAEEEVLVDRIPRSNVRDRRLARQRGMEPGYGPAPEPTRPMSAPAGFLEVLGVDLKKAQLITSHGTIPVPPQVFARIQSDALRVMRQFFSDSLREAAGGGRQPRRKRRKKVVRTVQGGEAT